MDPLGWNSRIPAVEERRRFKLLAPSVGLVFLFLGSGLLDRAQIREVGTRDLRLIIRMLTELVSLLLC